MSKFDEIRRIMEKLGEPRFPTVDELLSKIFEAPQHEGLTVLNREIAVLDFVTKNREQWHALLRKEGLFENQTPETVDAISTRCILERSNRQLFPIISDEIRKIDFRFIEILKEKDRLSEVIPVELIDIQFRALKHLSGRKSFAGPYQVLRCDLLERYVQMGAERHGQIAARVIGPLEGRLNTREISHCLKTALFLRNTLHLRSSSDDSGDAALTIQDVEKVHISLVGKFPVVPQFLLKLGLYSNLPDSEGAPGPSPFIAAMAKRGESLNPLTGSESVETVGPDEIWYKSELSKGDASCLDREITEELAEIAEENRW